MIDLHLHTTSSDGRSTPDELVLQVRAAGIRTFAVTDHDTVAALGAVARLARDTGLRAVPGIEITAVAHGRDVHVLGYFFDPDSPVLLAFLAERRRERVGRAREIGDRLAALGRPVEIESLIDRTGGPESALSLGRPLIAREIVRAGHAADVQEAFERYLGEGRPAFVERRSVTPADVVQVIHRAGGIASLAHPGETDMDGLVAPLADAGLDAIECFHCAHSAEATGAYLALAGRLGLAVTGGSDYHGEGTRRADCLGIVTLPPEHFVEVEARGDRRQVRHNTD